MALTLRGSILSGAKQVPATSTSISQICLPLQTSISLCFKDIYSYTNHYDFMIQYINMYTLAITILSAYIMLSLPPINNVPPAVPSLYNAMYLLYYLQSSSSINSGLTIMTAEQGLVCIIPVFYSHFHKTPPKQLLIAPYSNKSAKY